VRDGKNCAFLKNIGKDPRSAHNNAMEAYQDLLNKEAHIENVFQKQSSRQRKRNRLCLKANRLIHVDFYFKLCSLIFL
jgi:hypothetical protein